MFDFSATEFLVIALVALIVIGPRELPGLLRQFGQMVGKVRRMASEFQDQLNNAVDSSEVQEIRKDLNEVAEQARIEMDYDPAIDAEREIREAVEGGPKPPGKDVKNPDYGDDPDDALVDFPSPEADAPQGPVPAGAVNEPAIAPAKTAGAKTAGAKTAGADNAIVREPSTPRAAAAKRLPVTTGANPPADPVAAEAANPDGKPAVAKG